jgi:hypothetical protein
MKKLAMIAGATVMLTASSAFAGTIPYPNVGTENPVTYTFTATSAGDITAYFLGSGAAFDEQLGLLVNGVDTGITGLDDHSSSFGQTLDFGSVAAGATLVFYINVADYSAPGNFTYYSDVSLNTDGQNHVYSTAWNGGLLTDAYGMGTVPAGTYVGFEDLSKVNDLTCCGGPDYNYTDEQFIFTNTSLTATPLPSTWTMLLSGFVGIGFMAYRRKSKFVMAA